MQHAIYQFRKCSILLQSKELIQNQRDHLNATEAQCPVNFFTLAYPPIRNSSVQQKPKRNCVASVRPEVCVCNNFYCLVALDGI